MLAVRHLEVERNLGHYPYVARVNVKTEMVNVQTCLSKWCCRVLRFFKEKRMMEATDILTGYSARELNRTDQPARGRMEMIYIDLGGITAIKTR